MDRLWSGWRSVYVSQLSSGSKDSASFTFSPDESTGEYDYLVHAGTHVSTIMNKYPYGMGHMLVIPHSPVACLEDLSQLVRHELWDEVTDSVATAKAVYGCPGVNVGLNLGEFSGASVRAHLHVHVLPRWPSDTSFMATLAETVSLAEPLDVSASRLRAGWVSACTK